MVIFLKDILFVYL